MTKTAALLSFVAVAYWLIHPMTESYQSRLEREVVPLWQTQNERWSK